MATPLEWATEQAKKVKDTVYPDPEQSRLQAEMETTEADRNFRDKNYFAKHLVIKPTPIRLNSRISSGRVDVGRRIGR